jgi:hypothetical protein
MRRRFTVVVRIASGMNGLLGAAIMLLGPLLPDYAERYSADAWVAVAVGGIVMALGMTRLTTPEGWPVLSWLNLALGACILLSPWLFRFSSDEAMTLAGVGVGALIMVLAGMSARMTALMRQKLSRV